MTANPEAKGAGMGWQDIATAPRDGTWFIAFAGGEVFPACWEDQPDDDGYTGWCAAGSGFGGVLYEVHNGVKAEPTHWMPLPPPPVSA